MGFKPEPKMKTTEPSVDEAKIKKASGGKITGAAIPKLAAEMSMVKPKGASLIPMRSPVKPAPGNPGIPVAKKGGKMKKDEDSDPSDKDDKMACGGKMKKATGGVIEKFATGGVVQKFASGGSVKGHDACGFTATKKGGSW